MKSDQQLIRDSARRDYGAFALLFDRHSNALFRYALALVRDPQDAEDLVQETFMTAWKKLADIHLVGESMLPWLILTCRNHGANLRRSKALRVAAPLLAADRAVADPRLERLQHAQETEWIVDAINRLSATDRRIVELCLIEGREYHEAAAALGITVGVLTKRIRRTRTKLRTERDKRESEAPA